MATLSNASLAGESDSDPYAYLEVADDPRTRAWTSERNARARAYFESGSGREALLRRFEAFSAYGALGVPVERGGSLFSTLRSGRAEQAAIVVRDAEGAGATRVVIDPKTLDPSGLTALDWWYPSPRGTYVAYGVSSNGNEQSVLHVRRVADGVDLTEAIPGTRHCSLAWLADESGFFYTRYPGATVAYEQRVRRHQLGADHDADPVVFGEGRPPENFLALEASANGRWLLVAAHEGWGRNDLYVISLDDPALAAVVAVEGVDALADASFDGDRLIVRSNDGAPNFRVFEAEAARPARAGWREIVPERADPLEACGVARDALVLSYLHDVRSRIVAVVREPGAASFANGASHPVEPLGASVTALSCSQRSNDVYLVDTDFFTPPAVKRARIAPGGVTIATLAYDVADAATRGLVDPARYEAVQEWFVSRDGTRVPMFVLTKRGLARDASAPAILYGYGGFNVALVPSFLPFVTPWLDAGGVYAIANLRGGSEFGEAWHRAGMFERKQHVFDDAIAALETLGERKIADPARIAISGGSNGGLLVSAVATQRPDLLRAVHCAVPLCDMLRFHLFLIARLWIAEYGDPDDAEAARYLRAYSPYHNVRDGERYPAFYFVTAESDTRVDPMHARKMAAKLQAASSSGLPILCYVESEAGHGAGKPRAKVVDELADRWTFFSRELGLDISRPEPRT